MELAPPNKRMNTNPESTSYHRVTNYLFPTASQIIYISGLPKVNTMNIKFKCAKHDHLDPNVGGPMQDNASGQNYRKIVCSKCSEPVVQCLLCQYVFEEATARASKRSPHSYYMMHYKNKHIDKCRNDDDPSKRQCLDVTQMEDEHCNVTFGDDGHVDVDDNDQILSFDEGIVSDQISLVGSLEYENDASMCTDDSQETEGTVPGWETLDSAGFDEVHDGGAISNQEEKTVPYELRDFAPVYNEENRNLSSRRRKKNYNKNQLYFFQKSVVMSHSEGKDVTGGYRSLTKISRDADYTKSLADHSDAKLLFRLNTVLLNSNRSTQHDVMELVNDLCCRTENSNREENVPRSYNEARTQVTEGKFSTMANFPAPEVFEINGHACVSLKEAIRVAMGHGAEIQWTWDGQQRNREGLNGSRSSVRALSEIHDALKDQGMSEEKISEYLCGLGHFWTDSYLQSFVKQKDNSMWTLTVTILPNITIVLALGRGNQDHTAVIEHFHQEMAELRKGFLSYDGRTNKIVNVAFNMLYHSADRPERRDIQNTLSEGTYGRISNFSTDIDLEKLPACDSCFNYLIKNVTKGVSETIECRRCFCWTFDRMPGKQEVFEVPPNYPAHTVLHGDDPPKPPDGREPGRLFIGPVRLTTDWLKSACEFAYECMRQKMWTRAEFRCYLRTCCVNKALCEKILYIAEFDAKITNKQTDRSEAMSTVLPKIWYIRDIFSRSIFPEMPLHLVGHGMSDDVIHFFEAILKTHRRDNAFSKFVNKYIDNIIPWGLEWCKLKCYPKSAWVGENIMGYMRLFSYLYGMYICNHPFKQEDSALAVAMIRMMNALQSMLSLLMSRNSHNSLIVLDHIKVFMSTFRRCCKVCSDMEIDVQKTNKTNGNSKKQKLVDKLSDDDLIDILHYFNLSPQNKKRNSVDRIKVEDLKKRLEMHQLETKGNKEALQLRLFSKILKRSLETPDDGSPIDSALGQRQDAGDEEMDHVGTGNEKPRKEAWCKGGQLSLLANYVEQAEELGPLRDIW